MKRFFLILLVILAAGGAALWWTFQPAPLPLSFDQKIEVPPASPPDELRIWRIPNGEMQMQAGMAYRGGRLSEQRAFVNDAILIEHPQGRLLIDTGFGRQIDAQIAAMPWLGRQTMKLTKGQPVADQLEQAGVLPTQLMAVLVTHAHFDHVSGLPDLPGVPVWVTAEEEAFIRSGTMMAKEAHDMPDVNWQRVEFSGGPYLGFAASHDVFRDGSVVLVHAGGHTPGSMVIFVAAPAGKRYAFIGDLVWQREGLELPAERPWLVRLMADTDPGTTRKRIAQFRAIQAAAPDFLVVPAHDGRVLKEIPLLSERPHG